jgi:hypothetical protein
MPGTPGTSWQRTYHLAIPCPQLYDKLGHPVDEAQPGIQN